MEYNLSGTVFSKSKVSNALIHNATPLSVSHGRTTLSHGSKVRFVTSKHNTEAGQNGKLGRLKTVRHT